MSFKLLAHNWLAHPLAGLLWYIADKLASPTLEALGSMIHEAWAPEDESEEPTERERQRWQAEFNLIFHSGGMWTATEVADMSDEQLVALLVALVSVIERENEAYKLAARHSSRPFVRDRYGWRQVDAPIETIDGVEVARNQAKYQQDLADRLGAKTPPYVRRVMEK